MPKPRAKKKPAAKPRKRAVRKAADMVTPAPKIIPSRHQWTHDGGKVLILKCVDADRKSHGGFQWPESGPVVAPDWNPKPECGGGLHGWPWGFAMGDGKEPQYAGQWIVFEADPADVIDLGGKVKARAGEVVFCGTFHKAWQNILPGHVAYIFKASSGAASNSGDGGAASNSGYRGAASNSGYSGAASNSGDRGAASNSGDRGAASNSGYRGAASNSGYSGAASTTGKRSIAASTGEWSTVECGDTSICVVTADGFYWRVRTGAVCVQRTLNGLFVLKPEDVNAKDGDLVRIVHGKASK